MPFLKSLKNEILESCKGRIWWLRIPLLVYFIYVLFRHLGNPQYKSLIGMLNLGIHELGHVIFTPFGRFMEILGGSLTQCLVPIIGMINFYRQKDFYAIAISFGWLSTNIFEVATYVGDARTRSLNLVGFTQNPIHDWYYLLGKLHLLDYDTLLSNFLRYTAASSMIICIVAGSWIVIQMYKGRKDNNTFGARI